MTLEEIKSTTSGKVKITSHLRLSYTKDSSQSKVMFWEEEPTELYSCNTCTKAFYNPIALQNHMNLHHDTDDWSSETDQNSAAVQNSNQIVDGLCGFKFIPKREEANITAVEIDGLTKCIFDEETTYLIVKVDGEDL